MILTKNGSMILLKGEWAKVVFGDPTHKRYLAALGKGKRLGPNDRPKTQCCGVPIKLDECDVAVCEACKTSFIFEENARLILKDFPFISRDAIRAMVKNREPSNAKDLTVETHPFEVLGAEEKESRAGEAYFELLVVINGLRRWLSLSPDWGNGVRFREFFESCGLLAIYTTGQVEADNFLGARGWAKIRRTEDWRSVEFLTFNKEEYARG